jgi:hypothetical protein
MDKSEQDRMAAWVLVMDQTLQALAAALTTANLATASAAHWKSNHADQVARCALLRQREDLPVDRIPAYDELARLQGELTNVRGQLVNLQSSLSSWRAYAKALEADSKP